jgi:hypothetical protein
VKIDVMKAPWILWNHELLIYVHATSSKLHVIQSLHLGLLDVLVEDLADDLGAPFGDPLLVVLVVDKSDAKSGLVAFGPFEVAAGGRISVSQLVRYV